VLNKHWLKSLVCVCPTRYRSITDVLAVLREYLQYVDRGVKICFCLQHFRLSTNQIDNSSLTEKELFEIPNERIVGGSFSVVAVALLITVTLLVTLALLIIVPSLIDVGLLVIAVLLRRMETCMAMHNEPDYQR
jgi:hypothetical protein